MTDTSILLEKQQGMLTQQHQHQQHSNISMTVPYGGRRGGKEGEDTIEKAEQGGEEVGSESRD